MTLSLSENSSVIQVQNVPSRFKSEGISQIIAIVTHGISRHDGIL
jgi:hypothetical protein